MPDSDSDLLRGITILIARPSTDGDLGDRLGRLGARVIELAATRIERLDPAPLHAAMAEIASYDWLVFTSRHAVTMFMDTLRERGVIGVQALRVAAVGRATARALTEHGILVTTIPADERFSTIGLLESMGERDDVSGTRVLYPSAEAARDVLPEGLRILGARVDVVPFYRSVIDATQRDTLRQALDGGSVDLTVLAAPSSARAVLELAGELLGRPPHAVTIGPLTTIAAQAAGFVVRAEAAEASVEGLEAAVRRAASG